jgi:hypothetical protein
MPAVDTNRGYPSHYASLLRAPLHRARDCGARKNLFRFTRHLFLSAQARLGNVPGDYQPSRQGGTKAWQWRAFHVNAVPIC